MKDVFPVQQPLPGIFLSCVDPEDCRDTLYVEGKQKSRPVIYGAPSTPPGFVFHDKNQCPAPRTNTFQTLEEFYKQDYLQTFTDCLKKSDFSTRGAQAMGFTASTFFEGSSETSGQRLTASLLGSSVEFPYECCVQPSFYVANVRGLEKSTPYYNPLFTTVHDFNCFQQDGCMAGGSIRNSTQVSTLEPNPPFDFPKASPRSVMWYMQHSIATVEVSGTHVQFWQNGEVGQTGAIGGTIDIGVLEGSSAVSPLHTQQLGGNAALFSSIKRVLGATDTPAQNALKTYGIFSCPTTDGSSAIPNDTWKTSLMYPIPNTWAQTVSPEELECCAQGLENGVEGGQAILQNNLESFLTNAESQTVAISYVPTQNPITCSNYHCFESPYCQSLLARACKDFSTASVQPPDFKYGGHCTRWRNWASNNYASISPSDAGRVISGYPNNSKVANPPANFPVSAPTYPSGAFSSSVDQSVFTLLEACSNTDFSQVQPKEVLDQCKGLLSETSIQTNFPRLRPITFDTPIQYSHRVVTPYTVDSSNNQIDILLTYTAYVYKNDSTLINNLINTGNTAGTSIDTAFINYFIIVPQIENVVSLTTIFLDNIVALDSITFYNAVRENFNLKLSAISQFNYDTSPAPPLGSITVPIGPNTQNCKQETAGGYHTWDCSFIFSSFSLPFIDHTLDKISWDSNGSLSVVHNLINNSNFYSTVPPPFEDENFNVIGTGFTDSLSFINYNNRLENISFLYDPINVFWNSIMDNYNLNDYNPNNDNIYSYNNNSLCVYTETNYPYDVNYILCYPVNSFQNYVFTKNTSDANTIVRLNDPVQKQRLDEKITVVFNTNLSLFLGLDRQGNSVSVILNPYNSISCNLNFPTNQSLPISPGTLVTFSSPLSIQSPTNDITPFNLINNSQFWLTNTTPISIYSLSVLNYSQNNYTVTFTPPSNPATPLLPGQSVSVNILDPSFPDNSGSFTATPILFYDAGQGWQNNFNSPDFPVLGGVLSSRGIDISTVVNSYGNGERFNSFTADDALNVEPGFQGTISTILTYYKNQNVYTTGEANSGGSAAISQMFLSPLI